MKIKKLINEYKDRKVGEVKIVYKKNLQYTTFKIVINKKRL